jgi:AcrR family transcriptional regulator
MTSTPQRAARRTEALSKEQIVETAIQILDSRGEKALTFRALATELSTGSGALYWHVANKHDLLAAATDEVIARAMRESGSSAPEPREAIREIALGLYDAIEQHPWVGTEIAREPWQFATVQVFEGLGEQIQRMGVPGEAQFDAVTALVSYLVGLAGQQAAAARLISPGTDRSAFLGELAARWRELDENAYPFARHLAANLPTHDDREQFLAGIDLILTGIEALRAPSGGTP